MMEKQHLSFSKYHGLGNHFILIDGVRTDIDLNYIKSATQNLSDPFRGIGADGVILVLPSETAKLRMVIYNADGSEPEMCGTGLRCFARFCLDEGIVDVNKFTVETLRGVLTVEAVGEEIKVEMGPPLLLRKEIPMLGTDNGQVLKESLDVDNQTLEFTAVSMGNPHAIFFVQSFDDINLNKLGPKIENHPVFPNRTNVEFVKIISADQIEMKVWERGVGITQACGTGACAVLVAAVLNKLANKKARVILPGGPLEIEWRDDQVYMTGEAVKIYKGQF